MADIPVLTAILPDLEKLGFELSNLGSGSYSMNGIPTNLEGLNPVTLLQHMVETAKEKSERVEEEIQSTLALTLAKAVAIVPGQILSNEEMENLLERLLSLPTPTYTPDGKTILHVLKDDEFHKYFR